MIVGGLDLSYATLNDMWLCDTTTKLWKKVLFLTVFMYAHVYEQTEFLVEPSLWAHISGTVVANARKSKLL